MGDNDTVNDIPYIAFESALAREERHNKRLTSVLLTVVLFWFMTVAGCIWYISLPVSETTEVTQTADDIDNNANVTQTVGED